MDSLNPHTEDKYAAKRKYRAFSMTPPILLRNVTESDLPILFEQQLDPEATAMAAFPSRNRESFMLHWAKIMADDANMIRAILFDQQVAGAIMSFELDGEREVGYWI